MNEQAPSASLWRRIMGSIYEAILLVGPLMLTVFFYSFLTGFGGADDPQAGLKRLGLQALMAGGLLAYFTWGWSRGRCTLPMQTLGLRLTLRNGEPLSQSQAFIRALIAGPGLIFGLSWLWALFDRDRQALHDRLAGTRLVYVPVKRMI